MLLILAGVTIASLTGTDSAPVKANEAKQKQDIGAAKDQVYLFATNAQTEAYEEYYVKDATTTAGNASTMVSNFVKDEIKKEYASEKNKKVGLASIVASSDGSEVTISTTDFEVTGEIAEKGGNLTWGEVEALVPGLSLKTTSLNLAPGEEGTISYKVRGLSGNVSWSSDNEDVTVSNGVVAVANDAEEGTATITATIGEYTKTCPVTIEIKTGILLRPSSLTLEPGGGETIIADLRGFTGSVTWTKTSDANSVIASMDDSETNKLIITTSGSNEGTATITASITVGGTTYTSKGCTVTVREELIETGETAATNHNPQDLTALGLTWGDLKKIAKSIATNPDIDNDTIEVTAGDYTIGIGDTATVYYDGNNAKQVRILGFNHDSAKEETGISFEFANTLGTAAINTAGNNTNGWKGTTLRPLLNSTESTGYLGKLKATNGGTDMSTYIKEVKKDYLSVYNSTTSTDVKTTGVDPADKDKLWLLSCTEVWGNQGYRGCYSGYCKQQEGSQYAYYANKSNFTWNSGDGHSNYIEKLAWWWLRSPREGFDYSFCYVAGKGTCAYQNANLTNGSVAPGFTI